MFIIIIFLILLILIAVFSVQNAMPVFVTFFFWKFEASLAIIIFVTFLIGLLAGFSLIVFMKLRKKKDSFKKYTAENSNL